MQTGREKKYWSGVWQVSRVEKGKGRRKKLKRGKQRMGKRKIVHCGKMLGSTWAEREKNVEHNGTCINVFHLFLFVVVRRQMGKTVGRGPCGSGGWW